MNASSDLTALTQALEGEDRNPGKPWYQSKTVWGGLIAIAASLAHGAGIDIGSAEQGQIADLAATLAGTLGGLVAIYGRVTAKGAIRVN
jgi:hypothetical protein